jgi:serine/threonine protein kinase
MHACTPCRSDMHGVCDASLHQSADAAQVVYHVAKRLHAIHSVGYVHRDIKPANVLWLQRTNRWTVIDFGCAARIGEVSPLGFSVAYAAPEVIDAFRQGHKSMVVHAAIDAWSLGVLAFEFLTGRTALKLPSGREQVRYGSFTVMGAAQSHEVVVERAPLPQAERATRCSRRGQEVCMSYTRCAIATPKRST